MWDFVFLALGDQRRLPGSPQGTSRRHQRPQEASRRPQEAPGRPSEAKGQEYTAKNEVCALCRRRTLIFYVSLKQHVSKTLCFCSRSGLIWSCQGLPGSSPGLHFSRKACNKLGFGNIGKKTYVKTQGSAPGDRPNLVFYGILLSVSETPMECSRLICSRSQFFFVGAL